MTNLSNKLIISVFVVVMIVYLGFAGSLKFYFPKTRRDFFTTLSYSFLHGRLDIPYPGYTPNDLSLYNGKYYLYRGPLPSLVIMPLVFIWGRNISDILYTAVFGSINILFLSLLAREFIKYSRLSGIHDAVMRKNLQTASGQKLKSSQAKIVLLLLSIAFGSVHFYLSVLGTVWFTSQIVSLGAFILSLYFLFRFLNIQKGLANLFFSIIFLGLSFIGRQTFLFALPLYVSLIYKQKKYGSIKIWSPFILLVISVALFGYYNYFRFGSFLESGLRYMQVHPRYLQDLFLWGYFNLHFVPYNLYYFLLNTSIPDPEGTSIFVTSPLFLLLIVSLFKKHFKTVKNSYLSVMLFITAVFIIIPALIFNGTGWYQWGYRYALDIYPLLFMLLLLVINKYNKYIVFALSILSIIINLYGTFWMMNFAKYAYF